MLLENVSQIFKKIKPLSVVAKAALISKFNTERGQQYLLSGLGSLPGVPAKISQMLAMKFATSDNVNAELEPLPIEMVLEILKENTPSFFAMIKDISPQGITASLGQVHQVKAESGYIYAVKVQYPEIALTLQTQIEDFFRLAAFGPAKKMGFNLPEYHQQFNKVLLEEIDYGHELKIQQNFADNFANYPNIVVPKAYPEYSTKNILVQDWVATKKWQQFLGQADFYERKKIAEAVLEFFFHSLFNCQLLHNDLHLGNIGITEDSKLVIYDYGASVTMAQDHVAVIIDMIESLFLHKEIVFFDYLVYLGFDPQKLKYVADRLPTLCQKIFEPFVTDDTFDFKRWNLGDHFEKVLGEDKWFFRAAGPAWFFLMIKSLTGVLTILRDLAVAVNLRQIYKKTCPQNSLTILIPQVASQFKVLALTERDCAKKLVILVTEDGEKIVNLQMPARAVDNLKELIPESVEGYLQKHKIKVEEMIEKVQKSGYAPQLLIEIPEKRTVRISLE